MAHFDRESWLLLALLAGPVLGALVFGVVGLPLIRYGPHWFVDFGIHLALPVGVAWLLTRQACRGGLRQLLLGAIGLALPLGALCAVKGSIVTLRTPDGSALHGIDTAGLPLSIVAAAAAVAALHCLRVPGFVVGACAFVAGFLTIAAASWMV